MQKKENKSFSILKGLNSVQKQAVEYTDGPSLILAGAGSGKTRVLTHKIAYLIDRKRIWARNIVALTFTNKAAREMHNRISRLIKYKVDELRSGTFHSFFAYLLRRDCEKLGYTSNYAIYDEQDQLDVIKMVMGNMNSQDQQKYTPTAVRSKISSLKNKMITASEFSDTYQNDFEEFVSKVYLEYQLRLKKNNAMDFDDLLLKPLELFVEYPMVLENYQNRWNYIFVDEYQDTNIPQYNLLKLLAKKHRNISVVGDDDQSIYRWRGANIQNIWDFEQDFPDCKIFRLEQNYRSTANILAVAHSVIKNNSYRMEKELWTKKDAGESISLLTCQSGWEEAYKILVKIQEEFYNHKRNFSDFTILYRTNAQSRILEDALRREGIAYIIVGGVRFYERKEVKDMLAYLRVVCNPLDEVSMKRIINYPPRRIGSTTVQKIDTFCLEKNISFFDGIQRIKEIRSISDSTKKRIEEFSQFMLKYNRLLDTLSASELATTLVEELGILTVFKQEGTTESLNRIENIREFLNTIYEFTERTDNGRLQDFLAEVALITDIDKWNDKTNAVTLMTLHSAKGLEFPVVFIAGLEEGLLPLIRSNYSSDEDIEEERRLFYVGATRACEKLYLSTALTRKRYGESIDSSPSRFIKEIDEHLLSIESDTINVSRYTTYQDNQTGTDYVTVKQETKQHPKKLKIGALVRHPRFGKGVVHKLEGDGENLKAAVLFEELGLKKLVIKFAKLEIL